MLKLHTIRKLFKKALRAARRYRYHLFLELFAGKGHIGAALRRRGFAALSFEIDLGGLFDSLCPEIQQLIFGWLRSGCIGGIWLGTPCTSWSRARRGPPGSPWGPIRSRAHIYGLPNLSDPDKVKISVGNASMRFSAKIIDTCYKCGVPVVFENPAPSMIFEAPPIRKLLKFGVRIHVDMCQFGAKWRKRTALVGWHCEGLHNLSLLCTGKQGNCSYTKVNQPQIVLSGHSKEHKCLWTHVAQEYPLKFAHQAAHMLSSAFENIQTISKSRMLGG